MPLHQSVFSQQNNRVLVFIDAGVKDYQRLKNNVQPGAEVFILHPEVDGTEQITDIISQYDHIASIHIVSHGAPGTLYLGNTELSLDTLKYYSSELQNWFNSTSQYLTPALVLYGCNVAVTDAGSEFLEKLHQLTKATVYASSTPVGNSALGGNWNLDVSYGQTTPDSLNLIFQPEILETYSGVFAGSTGTDNKYKYYDSKDISGKGTVAFTDISSTGTSLTVARDQQNQVQLPFAFNFYGQSFQYISVGENGGLAFVPTINDVANIGFNNPNIFPSTNASVQQNVIAPFWDDLVGGQANTTGKIYYKDNTDKFIIQWSNFAHEYFQTGSITFQVVLHKGSNNIDFVYQDAIVGDAAFDYGKDASIGLNKGPVNGVASGLKYSVNEASLNGVTSIRFVTEPRLVTNTLSVKEGETITLTSSNFNATDIDNNQITYNITNLQKGQFKLNGSVVTQFTQQDINAQKVQFIHDGGEDAPSFSISITDGFNSSSPINISVGNQTINFTNVNDNPELTNVISSRTFNENALNATAAIIYNSVNSVNSVTLSDVDSPDFNGGNLTIAYTNGAAQEDRLSIGNTSSITLNGSNIAYNNTVIGTVDASNNGSNGKSLVINFTNTNATLAAVKALIESLTYQNTSNIPNPSRTISVTVNDGDGGTSTPVTTIINVTAENDAPVNNVPTAPSVNEDGTLTFAATNLISISDPDAGSKLVQVKLEATEGILRLNSTTGLDFTGGIGDGTDDAVMQFKGTIADINKALDGMSYKPRVNYNGAASVKVTTQDLGNSGINVVNLQDEDTINITVKAINDAPVNTVPQPIQNLKEDSELIFSSAKGNLIKIEDVDAGDIRGTGIVQVTLSATKGVLTLKQTTGIGFAANNSNGNSTITFTGKVGDINSALDGLSYRGNLNVNGEDTLTITTDDLGNYGEDGNLKDIKSVNIAIAPVNDAPINTVPQAQSVREDSDLIFSSAKGNLIKIEDVDAGDIKGTGIVKVTLSATKGVLNLNQTTGIGFAANNSNGNSTITFTGKVGDINNALDGLSYRGNLNVNGEDTLTITTDDLGNYGEDGNLKDTKSVKIAIAPVNDAPLNTVPQPIQNLKEDSELIFSSDKENLIKIEDLDDINGTATVQVTLSATKGVLNLKQTTGIDFAPNNSNGNSTITFTGKVGDINRALDGLSYRGNLNVNGEDTLTITTDDRGNYGLGDNLKDIKSVNINIAPVNDAPINTVPQAQSVREDSELIFSSAKGNLIKIEDVDAGDIKGTGIVKVTLSATKGVLNLNQTTGIGFAANNSNGNSTITFTGKVGDINNALDGLSYRGNLNVNGAETLTITTDDLGNYGEDGNLKDIKSVNINIAPVNDTPVNIVPNQIQNLKEDSELIFSSAKGNLIKIEDVDASDIRGTGRVQVTLSATKGVLNLKQTTGIDFAANNSNGNSTITFTGKVGDINSALDGLSYRGNLNVNGAETLTITTDDLGNYGEDGNLKDIKSVNIAIAPVNDAPINTVPQPQSVGEDENLVFSTNIGNSISISDVDAVGITDKVKVTLSVTKGKLALGNTLWEDKNSAEITLTDTQSNINKALQGLTYRGNQDFNGVDTLTITTNDLGNTGSGGELSKTDSVKITVNPVNDPPVNTSVPGTQSVNEDTNLVFSTANQNVIRVYDVDVDGEQDIIVNQAQVSISVSKGILTLGKTTELTFDPANSNNSSTVVFTGSLDSINQALDGLVYRGNQDFNGEDTLTINVNDNSNGGIGGNLSKQDTIKISVKSFNDSPINTLPIQQTIKEDTDLVFSTVNKNKISISDVDVNQGTGEAEIKLSVAKGVLTLQETSALTFKEGNGKANATMTFKGKVADINNALDSLIYRGNLNANGEDTLTITSSDLGNSGEGGALIDTDSVKITVTPVNDAPVNSLPTTQDVNETQNLIFSAKKGNAISIEDVDVSEGKGELEVTLSVTKGLLTLGQLTGLTFTVGDGKANAKTTFAGKAADINKALNGLVYLGEKDFSGKDTLTITTRDLGNFGENGIQIDQDTMTINVIPNKDGDGIDTATEQKVVNEIAKLGSADLNLNNLSQQAIYNGGIVAFFGADGGTKKPTVIAVEQETQKRLGGTSETPALVFSELKTLAFDVVVQNAITVFDDKDPKKASLKKVTAAQDIINFKLIPNPAQTNDNLQQQIKDAIKQKPVKIEIKLPDGPEDIAVNTILRRKADGTLYDFRRELNPKRGQLDDDLLTGAVLQDRNLDGKADWAVVYLQDGGWGSEEGLSDSNTEQSLVAVKLDLGDSRIEVRSNQDGLNFHGNRSFVQFTLNRFSGVDASEVGMARVRFGNNGQITQVDGKTVNSLDEAKQAIIQRGETLFSSLTNKQNPEFGNQNRTIAFEEGEQAVFFVIQNGTKDELLFNGLNSKSVQFSLPTLNSGAGIMTASTDERGQTTKLSFAGLFDIGARILSAEEVKSQLGLLAISQNRKGQVNVDSEVIDLKSSGAFDNKQVMLKVSLYREAANNNSTYLYRTDDAKGSIRDPLTGLLIDPTTAALNAEQRQRYLQLATSDRLVKDVQFQGGNLMTTDVSTVIKGGEYYAPLLVSNGTLSSIGNDFSRIFTSYMGINSDRIDHIRNLGNNVFGIEDVLGGGDRDYNDMILSIKQVQVVA